MASSLSEGFLSTSLPIKQWVFWAINSWVYGEQSGPKTLG